MKLDKLDRRLILELDRNARVSFAGISKRLRIPEETVRYRTNGLVRSGVIQTFLTVIDAGKLGNSYCKVLLKLSNVDETGVAGLTEYLLKENAVNWIARMDGPWDLGFTVRVRHMQELSVILDALREKYHHCIHRLIVAVNIQVDFLTHAYLTGKKRKLEAGASYFSPEGGLKTDEKDIRILREMADNPRRPVSEIAAAVGVSPPTIHSRLADLERCGVIRGYRVVLNSQVAGHINYYVLVYLNLVSRERLGQFVRFMRTRPNIIYIVKSLGEWDYELNIEVESIQQYRAIMMEMMKAFPDLVRDYVGMTVSDVFRLTLSPA